MPAGQITAGLERLSPKERACLFLVANRRSSKQIAAELGIAKTSVDTYCNRARTKLGVANRYEAARLAAGLAGGAEYRRESAARPSRPMRQRRWTGIQLLVAAGAILTAVLAVGSLISGLGALATMRGGPVTPGPAAHMAWPFT